MEVLNTGERHLSGLARGLRAGIILPSLFAIALFVIKRPEVAGFSVFGTIAHLVMVNYNRSWKDRLAEASMLTVLGAVMVSFGTLVSPYVWLAVGAAIVVGFLSQIPILAEGRIAVIRMALLLAFMLSVAVPSPSASVVPNLEGWLLSGIVAQPALLLLWIRLDKVHESGESLSPLKSVAKTQQPNSSSDWVGDAIGTATAMGLAILLTRLMKVEHAFWVVLGVLPLLHATRELATSTFWKEQAGTIVGFFVGASLAAIVGTHQTLYWLILPVITFVATYSSSAIGFVAGQAGFTAFAVVLFCILIPQQKSVGRTRVEDIFLGGAVSLAVNCVRHLDERGPITET
jgi:hypothetical protein